MHVSGLSTAEFDLNHKDTKLNYDSEFHLCNSASAHHWVLEETLVRSSIQSYLVAQILTLNVSYRADVIRRLFISPNSTDMLEGLLFSILPPIRRGMFWLSKRPVHGSEHPLILNFCPSNISTNVQRRTK